MRDEELGKLAYTAYCKAREWKSFNGDPLPHWEQQSHELRMAWCDAADAVKYELINAGRPG